MNEKEKDFKEIGFRENFELNLPEFFKALNKAISTNNIQSLYGLSKIFTRYCFKKLDN
ncbi:MAG: hypothetical protein JSV23_02810 [Promethearchaeota archaeon]|nr:MAG: hypothetical protein JSV23_02810 [Candidatus Lokiarchaeota archaeon]